jgi:hypothetical protein
MFIYLENYEKNHRYSCIVLFPMIYHLVSRSKKSNAVYLIFKLYSSRLPHNIVSRICDLLHDYRFCACKLSIYTTIITFFKFYSRSIHIFEYFWFNTRSFNNFYLISCIIFDTVSNLVNKLRIKKFC